MSVKGSINMTVQELTLKVNKAKDTVDKKLSTIERHKKQLDRCIKIFNDISLRYTDKTYEDWNRQDVIETDIREIYWAWCDVENKKDDIKCATKKYEEAQTIYNNWLEKLAKEEVKQQYISDSVPEIIKEFLNDWKETVIKWCKEKADKYREDKKELRNAINKKYFEYINANKEHYSSYIRPNIINNYDPNYNYEQHVYVYSTYRKVKEEYGINELEDSFKVKYNIPLLQGYINNRYNDEWLDKTVEQEKQNKLIDLMNRVTKITGTITNASGLYIANNGNLDGIIVGERGMASVNTIDAGGYNIQCYHFRTLVKKIR